MGAAQFMPRSYRAYAVDGDGDGRSDLWGSWRDVIASVANYLAKHGWRAGEPVVAPASLWFPRDDGLVAGSLAPDSTVKALRDRGLSFDTSLPDKAPALYIRVAGDTGPELRAGFHNFGVITRYNRSVLYALVGERPRPAHRVAAASAVMRVATAALAFSLLAMPAARASAKGRRPSRVPAPRPLRHRPLAAPCPATSRAPGAAILPFYEVGGQRYVVLPTAVGYVEQGVASWYGPDFHGGRTATGETYDMNGMTGAHPTLPLPAWVRVTNLENGRSVVVRLNDRGPFSKNRIIDLSRAAAEQLDMIRAGTAKVEVRSLASGDPSPVAAGPAQYFAQAGAFGDRENAEALAVRLRAAGIEGVSVAEAVVDGRPVFRVRAGPAASLDEFDALIERLRVAGADAPRLAL